VKPVPQCPLQYTELLADRFERLPLDRPQFERLHSDLVPRGIDRTVLPHSPTVPYRGAPMTC
jgi:hypothetical protein